MELQSSSSHKFLIQNYDKSANLRLTHFYLCWLTVNILAIGAHWDDIELGCGLTLKKLKEKGHNIFSVVVCSSQYGKDENEGMKESEALETD